MSETQFLWQVIEKEVGRRNLAKIDIPTYITDNIKYQLFDWQRSALQYFLAYDDPENALIESIFSPRHLMFNMATGTGKTLLMAALILFYYKKGYRFFIFFVNQNNIVGKTEENLINPNHPKYLFSQNIVVDDKSIRVKKVETFSDRGPEIQILFTSIQKLHNSIYSVKENSIYLEDLQKKNLVMLGDEAHHLNADTKKKNGQTELDLPLQLGEGASELDIEKSWENTVINKILFKGVNIPTEINNNILLEFTATVPREQAVLEKYEKKTIFTFDLKEFLKAGYTKEINLVSSSFSHKKRILQALLFNWYRNKIALKYGLENFKPVILFRSKLIIDSQRDYSEFINLIKNLSLKDFSFIEKYELDKVQDNEIYARGQSRILDIKNFIIENQISWNEIISYLQYAFAEKNCIITNSKTGTKTLEKTTLNQDRLLNSLEDRNNKISAIFTVQRLTEGWDVLNLFDIVRLYEGQNEGGSNTKTSEATTSEVQLIGRGVRYYPFPFGNKPLLKRKFDDDLLNELRVLEEFYYHSDDEHRYLSQLKKELKNKGYIDEKKKVKSFALKTKFKESEFYRSIKLWLNEKIENPQRRKNTFEDIKNNFPFTFKLPIVSVQEEELELEKDEDRTRFSTPKFEFRTIPIPLKDFQRSIIRKAINVNAKKDRSLLKFELLKEEIEIESIEDLVNSNVLGDFILNIIIPSSLKDLDEITNEDKLDVLVKFFGNLELALKDVSNPYIGSEFKAIKFSDVFDGIKEKMIEEDDESKILEEELTSKKWYVLDSFNGTSEERGLIRFLIETIGNLETKYEKVFVLRNEEVYKIYDFEKGRGFQPDFLLFLKEYKKALYYQVFIEPKGDQFKDSTGAFVLGKEGWKEIFLENICEKYGDSMILKFESKDYKLIGLPLFNEKTKDEFRIKYNKMLNLS